MIESTTTTPGGQLRRVVILGGGFAGVSAARTLAKAAKHARVTLRITLVDKNTYSLFTPMLPEVGTGILASREIARSLREATDDIGVTFYQASVTALDATNRTVTTDAGVIPYDMLIIALGATTHYFGMRDVQAVAYPFKELPDAARFHARVLDVLAEAAREPDLRKRRALLSFVIAGGGLTGVELAADLADFVAEALRKEHPALDPTEARITLIEAMPTLLPGMDTAVQETTRQHLEAKGVRILLGTAVTGATPDAVTTANAGTIPLGTLVWTAGIAGNPLVASFPFARGRGNRILCDDTLQVKDWPGVYAIGDCAFVNSNLTRKPYAQSAQIAEQEAKHVAANILRALRGEPLAPFVYDPRGVLISLGDRFSIVDARPLHLAGLPGYLSWKALYLAKVPAWRNRAAVLASWLINGVAGRATVLPGTPPPPPASPNAPPWEPMATTRK